MKTFISTGKIIAILSFVIGTVILALHLTFKHNTTLLIVGLYFTIIAVIINLIVFLSLLVTAIINFEYRFELLKSCGIILLNIPIAFLYFYLVITLTSSII